MHGFFLIVKAITIHAHTNHCGWHYDALCICQKFILVLNVFSNLVLIKGQLIVIS
jgi:hypothetical protein